MIAETNQGANHFIDLSHTIEHGLITYKGLPAPIVCDYLSREDSKAFYEEHPMQDDCQRRLKVLDV